MAREGSMRALLPITRQGACLQALIGGCKAAASATLDPRGFPVSMVTVRAGWRCMAT